jgi:hypothetical protein
MSEQRIIVTGTPIDGFTYIGPFDSFDSAESYADHIGVMGDWWITTLQSPGKPELPLHYPGAAVPIPPARPTHARKVGNEQVTVTGHVNGITIFDSEDERGEELLDVVFNELFEPIECDHRIWDSVKGVCAACGAPVASSTWEPTHYSRKDGSGAVMLTANRLTGMITFVNENGDEWTDPESEWEPA